MNIPKTFRELRLQYIILMCMYGFISTFMMGIAVIFAMTLTDMQVPLIWGSIFCSAIAFMGMIKAMSKLLIKI
nr:hypothetical protein [uncultured Mediterranean phage uvMED]